MQTVDPLEYFDVCQLRESRVLRFAFRPVQNRLQMDIDYAAEVVSHWFQAKVAGENVDTYQPLPSDFRRLIFFDVSWVNADAIPLSAESTHDEWIEVLTTEIKLPVVASLDVRSVGQIYSADLQLERNGDFHFRFEFGSLDVLRRTGRPKLGDGEIRMREDVETGELFEFRHPFTS